MSMAAPTPIIGEPCSRADLSGAQTLKLIAEAEDAEEMRHMARLCLAQHGIKRPPASY
jgi:hypothetical protein